MLIVFLKLAEHKINEHFLKHRKKKHGFLRSFVKEDMLNQGCLHHFLGVEVAVGVASTPTSNINSNTPILGVDLGVILGVTPDLGVFYIL
jgi:hypothetical protein